MSVWLAFVFSFVCCVVSQAPGDGDPLCTDEVINGVVNGLFSLRPTYPDNVRPLMDSRDYITLLRGNEGAHKPWQQVDNDNNNADTDFTEVSDLLVLVVGYRVAYNILNNTPIIIVHHMYFYNYRLGV